ncbi:hypothetical protein O3G_MSEX001816 [Manduca sexta]|uniref:MSP domain-containing protein n=1 Tax=Manduca sexta TaxID=7130 RepID=A0A921YL84_MANSE|nr:hypothetical protein O3G_MSEX001816 [Manduca sexta]
MRKQVLTIEPQNELQFNTLYEQDYTSYIRLTNPTNDRVIFKIKTTAPKYYCVRPTCGELEPKSKVEVAVTLQQVYIDPCENYKHKFMVQSVIAPDSKTHMYEVWKEVSPDQVMEYKLKCVFETPRGPYAIENDFTENEVTEERVAVTDKSKTTAKTEEDLVQNEEKRKDDKHRTGTLSAKTAKYLSKSENSKSDPPNTITETILASEEESKLRHENLQLKRELDRLRQSASGVDRVSRAHSYGPEKNAQVALLTWLGTAVGMAIIGIIIGKFVM